MSKFAHYLQDHLMGEVVVSDDARRNFSTDGSILTVAPTIIVYPRLENDVRKTARFTWQLAERGRIVPITARGSGTDQGGASLGSGILMVFPAHMNRIIELDNKNGKVVVEPGINYGKLQQTLMTHGRFLPPFPSSLEFSTIGGAVGNNAGGEKTFKYGSTRGYVKSLRVVLANGEVINTGRLSKRDLNRKLGLATFEGEIYRSVDTLIEEQHKTIESTRLNLTKNSAGYDLYDVKNKEGFDLTPLFVGSQGTLGIITEITLESVPHNPVTSLLVGMFESIDKAEKAILDLRKLSNTPSAIEMVDSNLLELAEQINPNMLKDIITRPYPKIILLIEFDDGERTQKKMVKKAIKILERYASNHRLAANENEQVQLWKLRHASALIMSHSDGGLKAIPFIEDGIVPVDKYSAYIKGVYELLAKLHIKPAIWGHAGDANLHIQPFIDLSQVGDRQTMFKLMDEYYDLVISLGGSTTAEHGDGRLRGPYLSKLYGQDAYDLFQKTKQIFDPYGTLNPGVKVNVNLNDVKPLLRKEYTLGSWYDHMPRT